MVTGALLSQTEDDAESSLLKVLKKCAASDYHIHLLADWIRRGARAE